jgi:methionyl-tRNA formyltransferase
VVLGPLIRHHDVVAVLTHPAGFTDLDGTQVESMARQAQIPVLLATATFDRDLIDRLATCDADVLVSTNWRTRLPAPVLTVARYGAINVHDALLPRYAGFGAVNWAIRDGCDHTGLTVHVMEEELDTGPILLQTRIDIGPCDTATIAYQRLVAQYGPAVLAALDRLARGERGTPQDPAGASFGHRITIADTRIDWTWPTTAIVDLVRAQSPPFVNAWCRDAAERLRVTRAGAPRRAARGTPGRVVTAAEGGVLVACGRPGESDARGVLLLEVAPDGGSAIPAAEYLGPVRGARYLG